jgi:Tol biopolymer transport system component
MMRRSTVFLLLVGAAGACGEDAITDPDSVGTLQVAITTAGADLDLDGYALTIDGDAQPPVDANETVTLPVSAGQHDVRLDGVAVNCLVDGTALRSVTVSAGDTTRVSYAVTCRATGVRVTASTTGGDLDPDGYEVSVDAEDPEPLGAMGSVIVTRLAPGPHTLTLSGLAANCTVAGDNPRAVVVTVGEIAPVSFDVLCAAVTGALRVTAVTTGIDRDGWFLIQLAGAPSTILPANGSVVLTGLAPGDVSVGLGDVAANCAMAGANPQTVTITAGDTVQATFEAGCGAATGVLEVSAATSGADYDLDGYRIRVDPGDAQPLGVNAGVTYESVGGGDYVLTLEGVASHCTVSGDNPRTATVTIGGATRDTARTVFEVTCPKTWAIAYSRPEWSATYQTEVPMIRLTNDAGSAQASFVFGSAPTWSPDGTQLAFVRVACEYDYYYYSCYPLGLGKAGTTASEVVPITNNAADVDPVWRPDGTRIAFTSASSLHLINPDGTGLTQVTAVGSAASPNWSPDGSAIAYTCQVDVDNEDICVINADGTALIRLTSDTARDVRPAWSPDGSRIVFVTTRYTGSHELALMNADGSAVTRLSPGTGALQPAWSADGTKIVYTAFTCDVYAGCTTNGLYVMNADGTGVTQLTSGRDLGAAWRP